MVAAEPQAQLIEVALTPKAIERLRHTLPPVAINRLRELMDTAIQMVFRPFAESATDELEGEFQDAVLAFLPIRAEMFRVLFSEGDLAHAAGAIRAASEYVREFQVAAPGDQPAQAALAKALECNQLALNMCAIAAASARPPVKRPINAWTRTTKADFCLTALLLHLEQTIRLNAARLELIIERAPRHAQDVVAMIQAMYGMGGTSAIGSWPHAPWIDEHLAFLRPATP